MRIILIDGYIDEPACLGVPPFISPSIRYIAGAIFSQKDHQVQYYTIDQLRHQGLPRGDLYVVVAGTTVPGKYLGGKPVTPGELRTFFKQIETPSILTGPAALHGFHKQYKLDDVFDHVITGDPSLSLSYFLQEGHLENLIRASPQDIQEFSLKGAQIVTQHPSYPRVIAELETYQGCFRSFLGGCSFCTEPLKGPPSFRDEHCIIQEVQSLYQQGIKHFRLGNQPCLFSYKAQGIGEKEFPRPNPSALKKLYQGIRAVAPCLETLHMDNANPGTLAQYPQECEQIARIIIRYHTPGDVAALGIESTDPQVISLNNLKVNAMEALRAIELLNKVGFHRGANGLPELLPGLNFVYGLPGESKKTYEENYHFLHSLLEKKLLVRRINLRQVITFPKTPLANRKHGHCLKKYFPQHKQKVRETIDKPMLQQITPPGTILRDTYTESYKGNLTLLRQMGTYPLLIGVPIQLKLDQKMDIKITSTGQRSVTGVPYPLNINTANLSLLQALPGVGKKRAQRLIINRPFSTPSDIIKTLDDKKIAQDILPYITI